MSFTIDPDQPLPDNVRRLAGHELDISLAALEESEVMGLEKTVHEVRKSCKRLRGLVRLLPPPRRRDARLVNDGVRDAARELGRLRDAHAVLGTFEDLSAATHGDRLQDGALADVRIALAARAERAGGADAAVALAGAAERLEAVRGSLGAWAPDDDVSVLLDGLARNYGRGRVAFRASLEHPTDEALHDWRKRAKYGWHHAGLLHPLAPGALGPLADGFKALSDGLGDDHDLAVLRVAILEAPGEFGQTAAEEALGLIDAVRTDLQDRCHRVGARLYAEPPKAFARRVGRYWRAWHAVGPERPVGEIADLAKEPSDRPPTAERIVAAGAGA